MSNLAQFLSQYNNAGGTELVNNGAIEMAGSPINRYVALTTLNTVTMNALSASLNTYLNIESLNPVSLSTVYPPSKTAGVQVNFPVNNPQQLIDNSTAQGWWQPYTSSGTIPYTSRVLYGRALPLSGACYKASVVMAASSVIIITADHTGNQNLYLQSYNPITRVLGNPITIDANADLHSSAGTGIGSPSAVIKLFPLDSTRFLMALTTTNQGAGTGYSYCFGAIVCTVDTATGVITKGTPNRQTTAIIAPQQGSAGIGADIAQLSTNLYVFAGLTTTAVASMWAMSVSGTTVTFGTAVTLNIGAAATINDLIAINSTSFVLGGMRSALYSFVATYNVSGTTITLGNNTSTFLPGNGSDAIDVPTIIKVDSTNFFQYARINGAPYTFYLRTFTVSGGVHTPGTTQQFAIGTTTQGNQQQTRDYPVLRTDAFKTRAHLSAPGGGNPLFANGTLVIMRTAGGPLMFTVSGGTVTSANGSNLTEFTYFSSINTNRQMVWPTADGSKLYMSDYTGSVCKQITLGGGNITVGADFIATPPSNIDSPEGGRGYDAYILNDNFGFGSYKMPSGVTRYYPLNYCNKYNLDAAFTTPAPGFNVEAALTSTGSAVVISDFVKKRVVGLVPTGCYILDGMF